MPGNPIGLRRRPKRQENTYKLLAPPDHGRQIEGILRNGFRRGERSDAGRPAVPTIFNVVVNAVFRHWVNGIVEKAEARGETGREGRHQAALFYANDGMVVSSDPAWLQGTFTALVGLFDKVGLRKNVGKTVIMVCHPCQVGAGNRTEEAYWRRITVEGRSYAERQRERI